MTTRVKICGVTTPDALIACAEAGADWVGFVFADRSPRFLRPDQAAGLAALAPLVPKVGLFVDPTDDQVADVLAALTLAALQLYAAPGRAAALRARFGIPVWRSVPIAGAADLPTEADADALVIEPAPPPGASRPGGNARTLDWSMLAGWRAPAPWLLAGGLTPGNVARAVALSGAPAVDVSSGVEREPGRKDPAAIAAFVRAAR